jgi:hypothetical protein
MANLNFDKKDLDSWVTDDDHKKIIRELEESFVKFLVKSKSDEGYLNGSA